MPSVSKWYALYLRSRYEKKVYESLCKKGIETFLPLVKKIHIWSDRKKKIMEPLFRGYVFVKTDLKDKELILMTEGVVRFVGINQQPSWIPELQIEWIRQIISESLDIQYVRKLEVGTRVRVTGGPLIGVEGIIHQVHGTSRVVVSITAIEQAISIQVPAELLELIHN